LVVCGVLCCSVAAEAAPESYYQYWNLGGAYNTYTGSLERIRDDARDHGYDAVSSIGIDVGVYWPLPESPRTLLGCVLSGGVDHYQGGAEDIKINTFQLGYSAMHYFGAAAGAGLFLRADIGMAWYEIDGPASIEETGRKGYGLLVGGGYGIPVGRDGGTRVILNVNYALRTLDGGDAGTLSVCLGFLL
jgi:hypothetical protein